MRNYKNYDDEYIMVAEDQKVLIEKFLVYTKEMKSSSTNTVKNYRTSLNQWVKFMNNSKLNTQKMVEYAIVLKEKYAYQTLKSKFYSIISFNQYLRLVLEMPILKIDSEILKLVKTADKDKREIVAIAAEDARIIDDEVYGLDLIIFDLGLYGGLRIGEIASLQKKHLQDYKITIESKNSKSKKTRTVNLPTHIYNDLMRLIGKYDEEDYVLKNTKNDKMGVSSINVRFNHVLDMCELTEKGYTPHSMRHHFGTQLHIKGADPIYIKEQMGHSSIQTTIDYYIHETPQATNENIADKFF